MRSRLVQARSRYLVLVVLSPLAILALWVLSGDFNWVSGILLPSPGAVVASFVDMARNGYSGVPLYAHVGVSLARVFVAYVCGVVAGVTVGLLRGRSASWDAIFLVPMETLRPIPPLGLIPLFILWFGIGELSKVVLIMMSVFLIMMVNAQAGAASCPIDVLRAARSLGANRWQTFRYVILPSALPQVMTGLRVAMGTAFSVLVASELLGGDRGLGFIVLDASNFFRTSYVFAGIAIIGGIGLTNDRVLAWLTKRIVHWQPNRR